jgi:hypothetical protein
VDPGPIIGVRDPTEWAKTLRSVQLDINAHWALSEHDKQMFEDARHHRSTTCSAVRWT